jgi:hypothetical protein
MRKSDRTSSGGETASASVGRSVPRRLLQMALIVIVIAAAVSLLMRSSVRNQTADGPATGFKEVGRNGPIFTVSVPASRAADEQYLMKVAEQLSARDVQAGASGQVSVMIWPDNVTVPKEPPTTELDASMKTQAAGIFINPKLNVKHLIRFKDGQTVAERDFGRKVQ